MLNQKLSQLVGCVSVWSMFHYQMRGKRNCNPPIRICFARLLVVLPIHSVLHKLAALPVYHTLLRTLDLHKLDKLDWHIGLMWLSPLAIIDNWWDTVEEKYFIFIKFDKKKTYEKKRLIKMEHSCWLNCFTEMILKLLLTFLRDWNFSISSDLVYLLSWCVFLK